VPLDLSPVTPQQDGAMQYAFDIAMGVRRRDSTRSRLLNAELTRRQADIDRILGDFGVPLLTR